MTIDTESAAARRRGRPRGTSARALELIALRLFTDQGFEQTTVDQIATAAGVSRRTFFRYFDSKSDVLWSEFDAEVATRVREAGQALNDVRGNLALLLHDEHRDIDDVIAYAERWALMPRNRAEKGVQFLTDPTWRAYIFCYLIGLTLCRDFTAGDPANFERLLTEQLLPEDLAA